MISLQKPESWEKVKARQQRADDLRQRAIYTLVDQRDQSRCRVCHRYVDPFADALVYRGEHHHIVFRSKQGPTITGNVVTLCVPCHRAVHDRKLTISGDADAQLLFTRGEHTWQG